MEFKWGAVALLTDYKCDTMIIKPNGEKIEVDFAEHEKTAREIIEDEYPKQKIRKTGLGLDLCLDTLVFDLGYVAIHDDAFSGTVIQGEKWTKRQYFTLKRLYGDSMLFRGWTVDLLYKEQLVKEV